jgi:hypothetical protein
VDEEEAFARFSDWYEACLENGISPEDVVIRMGGMVLITNEQLIERLQNEGDI